MQTPNGMTDHGIAIVVLDRGFVYVGRTQTNAEWCHIEGRNIRYWGTTEGLAELCDGPTKKTKLDRPLSVRAPMRAVISIIPVAGDKWTAAL